MRRWRASLSLGLTRRGTYSCSCFTLPCSTLPCSTAVLLYSVLLDPAPIPLLYSTLPQSTLPCSTPIYPTLLYSTLTYSLLHSTLATSAPLTLDAIVGIIDPLRNDVKEAVKRCQRAGITVRMVTGDNLDTAKAIARQCGILRRGGIAMEGSRLRTLAPRELDAILPRLQVVARSSPEDKYLLVTRLNGANLPRDAEGWDAAHPALAGKWETHRDLLLPGYRWVSLSRSLLTYPLSNLSLFPSLSLISLSLISLSLSLSLSFSLSLSLLYPPPPSLPHAERSGGRPTPEEAKSSA